MLTFDRIQHFEAELAELHQKLAGLQKELSAFELQYDSLLEQVAQQQSVIQQLSDSRETQKEPGEKISCMETEETNAGECTQYRLVTRLGDTA